MEFALKNKDTILDMYNKGSSSYEIAESLNTYSTKILRALKFLGKILHNDENHYKRDYSDAQKLALKHGRAKHPTEGKNLDKNHKEKIGISRSKAYHSLSDEEKQKISNISKKNWDALGKAKQEEIRLLALDSVRIASKLGSKTERHIHNGLIKNGYSVDFHKTGLVFGSNLEVDLFLPEVKTAIEIDGPGHFIPIWGEEKLAKQKIADISKQGILLNSGYVIIRIRQIDKSISLTKMNHLLSLILKEVESIRNNFPEAKDRLIEIEVKMDKQEESKVPSMLSPEWNDYAMGFFTEKELIDGNPLTAGLRRVAEILIGEIISSKPISVDRIETNDPIGKTTVVYEVQFLIKRPDGTTYCKTYADVADVWAGNTDDMFAAHAPATASTKAEGRALEALKLRVVAAEELCKKDVSQFLGQQTEQLDVRIKPEQIKYIDMNCKKLNIDVVKFINSGEKVYNSIYEVKRDAAAKMIDLINQTKRGEQNLNKDLVGYKEDWNNK